MVTYILLTIIILATLISHIHTYWARVEIRENRRRIDELQERFLLFEKYVCGADGHFEDSVRNGSSLNSIINATLLEVAKLNPNDWTVEDTNKDKVTIVDRPEDIVVKTQPDVRSNTEYEYDIEHPIIERGRTVDEYGRIEYTDDDFKIEEE